MDQSRSHIPRNNLPKQFCERCFEQGDQKWQQNELGLGFELDKHVCGRKKECVGAGISGGEPLWAHEARGALRGGHALDPRGQVLAPPDVFSVPNILKYSRKIIFKFQGIWRTFIFGVFLYCMDNQKIVINYYFCFI